MRVLFVTHNIPRAAGDVAGSFVLRLAVALRESGIDVDVLAPGGAGLPPTDVLEGVPITRVRYGRDADMTLAYGGQMAELVRASWRGKAALLALLRALRRAARDRVQAAATEGRPYDVVHVHWWFPAGLALWRLWRHAGPATVVTMHGSDVRLAQGIGPAQALMRRVLRAAAVRTAVSTWLADAAVRIAPAGRIHVAPMPVDVRHFDAPDAAPDGARARQGILFVGRLNAQKGLASLLDALTHPALAGAHLDVVGDGPDADALRARAHALGVSDRLTWHGVLPPPQLAERYRAAAALAVPSIEEGLGLVAVEAQLCETPVVAYASGGIPDVVRIDAGGTLVAAGDSSALAEALARLLADEDAARAAGQVAREAMVYTFAPESAAHRYRAYYESAVRRRTAAAA